jgi:hypothetical protein
MSNDINCVLYILIFYICIKLKLFLVLNRRFGGPWNAIYVAPTSIVRFERCSYANRACSKFCLKKTGPG